MSSRSFAAARERYVDRGLEVLGIVFDDDPDAARDVHGPCRRHLAGARRSRAATAAAYKVNAPPLSFFIDGSGMVRSITYGPPPSGTIDDRIAAILPGRHPGLPARRPSP